GWMCSERRYHAVLGKKILVCNEHSGKRRDRLHPRSWARRLRSRYRYRSTTILAQEAPGQRGVGIETRPRAGDALEQRRIGGRDVVRCDDGRTTFLAGRTEAVQSHARRRGFTGTGETP